MLESALVVLGTSTSKAVARMWLKSDVALDISEGFIDKLASRVPALGERRRAARQFEDLADRVAKQLTPFIQSEFGGIAEYELQAAILGVADVVGCVQEMDVQELLALNMDPVALEDALKQRPQMQSRRDLDAAAALVFDKLLTENCNFVVEITAGLPGFESAALTEVLKRESAISERVQAVLDRIPQPAALTASADQEFEVKYRRAIARHLDRLDLFGLTLSENSSQYELSIAYITLSAATSQSEAAPKTAKAVHEDEGIDGEKDSIDAIDNEDEAYLKVDQALSRSNMHLLRGEAGSGKTTLLQWLAVSAARDAFSRDLSSWSGAVPFFIQLRRYANSELPAPEQFLEHTARSIAGVMPPGWVHRQLEAGNGLFLIDGVDELPEHQRASARAWMLQLLDEYPACRFVVTTRPPAIPEDWLDSVGFNLLELLPMSLPDILSFVQHWYDAARKGTAHVDGQDEVLLQYQNELVRVIRDSPTIRALATAPLLCAMLCALNRDRRTQLPRDRMELYRIALESLLDRRDVEREISQHDRLQLGLREKETLLQDLAYWLVLNEQSDVSKTSAVERVKERLTYMSSITSPAEVVFDHLLLRSGLIREPVTGRIDFIHRTFQEYLAAARAMSEGNVPMLISKADDDQWREVIILSAGHGTTTQRSDLLLGLLQRGHDNPLFRHRFHLLAVACLETAIELAPETKLAVTTALRETLPPTNMTEARAVASAGPVAATPLGAFKGSLATTAAACVRALCLIGGDEALSALQRYRHDTRVTVIRELIRGWDYFDREVYARDVLAASRLDYGTLAISDPDALQVVDLVPNLRNLVFTAPSSTVDLAEYSNIERVNVLDLTRARDLRRIDVISDCKNLASLKIANNSTLTALPRIPGTLESLDVTHCSQLTDMSAIESLENLHTLTATFVPADLAQIVPKGVRRVQIQATGTSDYSWLVGQENLETLVLTSTSDGATPVRLGDDGSLSYLSASERLTRLSVWWASQISSLDGLSERTRTLQLLRARSLTNATALSRCKNLRWLGLDGASGLEDFTFLRSLPLLLDLDLEDCSGFTNIGLLSGATIHTLTIAGTGVRDLSGLLDLPMLRSVDISGCDIADLRPLSDLQPSVRITIDINQAKEAPEDVRANRRRLFVK